MLLFSVVTKFQALLLSLLAPLSVAGDESSPTALQATQASAAEASGSRTSAVVEQGMPITGLYITSGNCPLDYYKINTDLNKGAKGDYIWLCYTRRPDLSPIYDVALTANKNSGIAAAAALVWFAVESCCAKYADLNAGAGGDYVYLWYLRDEGSKPKNKHPLGAIQDIFVGVGGQAPPEGYYGPIDGVDMNQGAGGDYLFLYVRFSQQ